jgi:hypothetical protein
VPHPLTNACASNKYQVFNDELKNSKVAGEGGYIYKQNKESGLKGVEPLLSQ